MATIVIKRLKDALAVGDPVRAVIRETHVNQDGHTESITSPSQTAQVKLIRDCYQKAGLDPLDTQYFEVKSICSTIAVHPDQRAGTWNGNCYRRSH